MKEIMKELVRLAVLTIIVMVAFFSFMAFVAVMIKGIEFLPKYIGGFGTFLLYICIYAIIFMALYDFSKKHK
jgi:hypothetical protein